MVRGGVPLVGFAVSVQMGAWFCEGWFTVIVFVALLVAPSLSVTVNLAV